MKTEKLISQYLDGELSREQDKELRDILNEDEFAKRQFESSVDVHMALKEDAKSVNTPDDLEQQTEDIIMMKILNKNQPVGIQKSKRRKPAFFYLSAAVVVIMFGLLFRIYENGVFNNIIDSTPQMSYNQYIDKLDPNTFTVSVPDNFTNEQKNAIKSQNSNINNFSNQNTTDIVLNEQPVQSLNSISEDISSNQNYFNANEKLIDNTIETLPQAELPLLALNDDNSDVNSNLYNSEVANATFNTSKNLPFNGILFLNNNIPYYSYVSPSSFPTRNKISISSNVSNSFLNNGINSIGNESVVNYSQSIAYNSTDRISFGLEFGYLEFNATRNVKSQNSGSGINELSVNSSVEVQDPTKEGGFIPAQLPVVVNNQLFWGSVFVNYDVVNYNDLTVESRLGTGATSDGPLSYARLQAKYKLYDGIYLNLGSEGRMFVYTINDKKLTGWNLSLIYGIQFAF